MALVDATTGKVLATAPIGGGVDANGFDPGTGLAFSSNGEGTLTVAKEDPPGKLSVLANVPTQRGARSKLQKVEINGDDLKVTNPGRLAGGQTIIVWKRAK